MPPNGAQPPSDISTGELWRTQQTILSSLETLTHNVQALPSQIVIDVDSRYSDRWTAARADSDELHRQIGTRLTKLEQWRDDQHPTIARIDDRVAMLQRVVFTAVSLILTGDVAAVFALLSHK
jgi:DNA-binding helix-hairpin-helix protein with protein kinase domain